MFEQVQAAKEREIDGLITSIITDEFKKHHLFSIPYISLEKIIFTSKENSKIYNSLGDLRGKKFGSHKSNELSISVFVISPRNEVEGLFCPIQPFSK